MRRVLSNLQAAAVATSGYTLWVLCDVALKFAGASHLPRLEVVAAVGLAAAFFAAVAALLTGGLRSLWPKQPWLQSLRAMLDLGNNLGVLIALQHMALSMFYILIFLAPLVAAVLARVALREKLYARQIIALLIGFLGVAIAVNPLGGAHEADQYGYAAALLCVACFSANMVWSRRMTQSETGSSMACFSGLAIALIAGIATSGHVEPFTSRTAVVIAATALTGVLGNMCFFFALRHSRTAFVSQFHYTQLPVGAAIAYAIWGERPTLSMAVGAVLIVAAAASAAATRPEPAGVALS